MLRPSPRPYYASYEIPTEKYFLVSFYGSGLRSKAVKSVPRNGSRYYRASYSVIPSASLQRLCL